jgi:signal recognition particle GTPase
VTVVDEAAFGGCLDEISHALLQANICFAAVRDLQTNVKAAMFEEMQQASRSRRP